MRKGEKLLKIFLYDDREHRIVYREERKRNHTAILEVYLT